MSTHIGIRPARPSDRDELRAMQAASFRALGAAWYDSEVIDAFIDTIGTMDDALLEQGTYYVAVANRRIVGCGGWSDRTPGYAAHTLAPHRAAPTARATVRSIFVHPAWARRGIARTMMGLIESDIAEAGFDSAFLTATLSGVSLYRHLGYRGAVPVTLALPRGLAFVGLAMAKDLTAVGSFFGAKAA